VSRGQVVYVNDSTIFLRSRTKVDVGRDPLVEVRFFVDVVDETHQTCQDQSGSPSLPSEVLIHGHTGLFGGDLSAVPQPNQPLLRFRDPEGVRVTRDENNLEGCLPYGESHEGAAVLLNRGECTFLQKLVMAQAAGAIGVVVISDENLGINPSADEEELIAAGDLSDVAILVLTAPDGNIITEMMDSDKIDGSGQLRMALQRLLEEDRGNGGKEKTKHILYLNGHPLLNTHLLV
jgi:mannosidase alpha-like ER degradation enhancer 1